MNAVSIRGDWVGQVIDGRYPLLEWLGGSGSSGTFFTELDGPGSQKAAIKLSPSSPQAEDRFTGWPLASKLSHPHLAQIHHFGRADVEEGRVVYIVSDLAEELLSQIIPERALSPDEARQMLTPVLDALEYLHNAGYVHGHLKPSNILVVENEIKISSDALIPIGKPAPELLNNDIHIAPEVATGPVSAPADIWSLGVTLVEALTQELPIWDAATDAEPELPASIPAPFAEIARGCLHPDPSKRLSLAGIHALLEGKQLKRPSSPTEIPQQLPPPQHRSADKPLPSRMPYLPLVIGLVLLVAIIIGLRVHSKRNTNTAPLQTETTRQAPPAEPESKAVQPQVPPPAVRPSAPAANKVPPPATTTSGGQVVDRDIPDVPQRASNTIHGTVAVAVRVSVDASGAVNNAEYATRGPSAYFARMALESAHRWRFSPPQQNGRAIPSTWMLHYKFRRGGVDVTSDQVNH